MIERTTLDDLLKLIENNYAVKGRRSLRRVEYAEQNLRERKAGDITSEDLRMRHTEPKACGTSIDKL